MDDTKMRKCLSSILVFCIIVNCLMWNSNIAKVYATQTEELDAGTFNGNRYKVFDDNLSWSDAKAYCESLGGHLATVESKEENDFIFSIIQNKEKSIYWLGAFHDDSDNKWKWVTDELWSYTNWSPGNPDHYHHSNVGYENYLGILRINCGNSGSAKQWNDFADSKNIWGSSTKYLGFVCEWENEDESYGVEVIDFGDTECSEEFDIYLQSMPKLSEEDAKTFLAFIYNDSKYEKLDLSNDKYYKILTGNLGDYNGNLASLRADLIGFSIFTRTQVNHHFGKAVENMDYLSNELIVYLQTELEGMNGAGEDVLNEYTKKLTGYVADGIEGLFANELAQHTGIVISGETLDTSSLIVKNYKDLLNIGNKVIKYVNRVVAGIEVALLPLENEKTGRYEYFESYISNRKDYNSADDLVFQTLMDYNFMAIKDNTYISSAIDLTTWITGKDSWSNHRDTLDRWAEYFCQLEKYINVSVHNYEKSAIPATCVERGCTEYHCLYCGRRYITDYVETDVNNHKYTEIRGKKAATCKEAGYTGDIWCIGCGTKIESGIEVAATGNHVWDAGMVTTASTCTKKGEKTYTCTVCGTTKLEEIAATGHKNTEIRNQKAATCNETGYTGDSWCKDCNTKLSNGAVIAATGNHVWDSGQIAVSPTCIKEGSKVFACTLCGESRTEEIKPLGHTLVKDEAVKATCKETGLTEGSHCSVCNEVIVPQKIVEKLKIHKWDEGKVAEFPTCTDKGEKIYTCKICNAIKAEEIKATGHKNTEICGQKAPTCTETGYTGDTVCLDCGNIIVEGKEVQKTAHNYQKNVIRATLSNDGRIEDKCTDCGRQGNNMAVYAVDTMALSRTNYVYDGTAKEPDAKIMDRKGNSLIENIDYIVPESVSLATNYFLQPHIIPALIRCFPGLVFSPVR